MKHVYHRRTVRFIGMKPLNLKIYNGRCDIGLMLIKTGSEVGQSHILES